MNLFRTPALQVFALGWLLPAGIVSGQNLASNPGFETGNNLGWSPFGAPTLAVETAQVHSGSYACLVTNRTATWNGIAQSFAGVLQPGQTYNASAWVFLPGGASQNMQFTAQQTDGGGTSYTVIAADTVPPGAWTQVAGQFTLNISNVLTGLNFYLEVPSSSNAAFYVDDLLVQSASIAPTNGSCTVDGSTVFQRIDGFGASSAWNGSWTAGQADMFFSTNSGNGMSFDRRTNFSFTGIGLSLLRNHIAYPASTLASATPGTSETSIMQLAQARGARVWSAPWTPDPGFKNNNAPNGGSFLGSGHNATNLAYASQLANYVASMKHNYGVNLYALSVQNEPDANVTSYEACSWTGTQFHDFVTNLYTALSVRGLSATKIILPESQNWSSNPGLYTPTLNDPSAASVVGIIANHDYVANNTVGNTTVPAALAVAGKPLWETEVSQIGGSYDGSITNAIYWAGRIHLFLTEAQVNAWHYWWLVPFNADNEGLVDTNGVPAKRMYALGQFARFVRPNFYRVKVAGNTGSAQISAYQDSVSGTVAIVAINPSSTTVTQTFNLTHFGDISTVTPWITSATMSLSDQPALPVSGSSFAYALPALSVVTFTGAQTGNSPPVLATVGDQVINAGVTLVVTNAATDTNVPAQTLSFSLLNGPANATLNSSNGVFAWRPLVGQAGTTNPIVVRVADNGTPSLSATNGFSVIVNPLSPPTLSAAPPAPGQLDLLLNGPAGPDYTVLVSTNLDDWQVLLKTNSPVVPVQVPLTNLNLAPVQFYRIQLGP